MPADARSLAIATALRLPVQRLHRLHFGMRRDGSMLVMAEYGYRGLDADALVQVMARYAGVMGTADAPALATDAEHF